jgi:iron(III) transport system substrate-binding protein
MAAVAARARAELRSARADRGGQEGRQGHLLHADFAEVEQEITKEFNKRFPFVKVEMVRAPGGQLITRINTEAAAGKLAADVINPLRPRPDPGLAGPVGRLCAAQCCDYREDVQVSPKIWPRQTLGWSIAYNTDLVKNPPSRGWT